MNPVSSADRFVQFAGLVSIEANDCWTWHGSKTKAGYSLFAYGSGHQWILRYLGTLIPWTSQVHHKCRNPGCVNPSHLQVLTPREHGLLHNPKKINRIINSLTPPSTEKAS